MRVRMFHWQHGWYFSRQSDGTVYVYKGSEKAADDLPKLPLLAIPAAEWCSIVAAVSATGETAETYQAAVALHG